MRFALVLGGLLMLASIACAHMLFASARPLEEAAYLTHADLARVHAASSTEPLVRASVCEVIWNVKDPPPFPQPEMVALLPGMAVVSLSGCHSGEAISARIIEEDLKEGDTVLLVRENQVLYGVRDRLVM